MILRAADLFCGAGGTSTGIMAACANLGRKADLLAVNHWTTAINTHSLNHPGVRHLCESLDVVNPQKAVGGKHHLHLLAASPECTHHSIAAGGRPRNDQSRATAWHVCRWAADLSVDHIFLENVPEFPQWGPLTKKGKVWKLRKAETFKAFENSLRSMRYTVEWRIQNAADYGDPTNRKRFILMASRRGPVRWPEPTHGENLKPFRTAREIIDWSLKGIRIDEREKLGKKALSDNTMARIAGGFKQFSGAAFVVTLRGTTPAHLNACAHSIDEPITAVVANGNHHLLVEPFIIHCTHHGKRKSHSVDGLVPTVTGAHGGEMMLVEPFIVKYYGTGIAKSVDLPLDAITTKDRFMLVMPDDSGSIYGARTRMLQPHELGAAMSFPRGYKFTGTKHEQVKQIGNAVPVELARAHIQALVA